MSEGKPLSEVFAAADERATEHVATIIANEVSCLCGWVEQVNGRDVVELFDAHAAAAVEAREEARGAAVEGRAVPFDESAHADAWRLSDDFLDWLRHGQQKGWVSTVVCMTHDVVPTSLEAEQAWGTNEIEPCETVVRVWMDGETPAEDGS